MPPRGHGGSPCLHGGGTFPLYVIISPVLCLHRGGISLDNPRIRRRVSIVLLGLVCTLPRVCDMMRRVLLGEGAPGERHDYLGGCRDAQFLFSLDTDPAGCGSFRRGEASGGFAASSSAWKAAAVTL